MAEPITSQPIKNARNSIDPNNEENPKQAGQTEHKVKEQIKNDKGCCRSFFCCCSRKKCLNCQNVVDDYEPDIDFDPKYENDNYESNVNNGSKSAVNDNYESNFNSVCKPNINDHCVQNLNTGSYGRNNNSNMCSNVEPARTTVAVNHNYCSANYEFHNNYSSYNNHHNYSSHNNHHNSSSNNNHHNHSSNTCDNDDYSTTYDAGDSGGGGCGGGDD